MYMFLPLYHAAGGAGGLSVTLTVGASMVLRKKFSASNFWKDCVAHEITVSGIDAQNFQNLITKVKK